jgi:glyoxylase-like metal-dependent hydrolase (beta-lactamase superfamily II)
MSEADARRWHEPGVVEEGDGVFRIPVPIADSSLHATNVYVLEGEQGLTLVDAGWALDEAHHALSDGLASVGHKLTDIRLILATHVHADHYTLAMPIRSVSGSQIALGSRERPFLDSAMQLIHPGDYLYPYLRQAGADDLVRELVADGFGRRLAPGSWELPDQWLDGGESFSINQGQSLRALATPGHTAGHVVFIDDEAGLTFAGDHILPSITPSIGYETPLASSPLSAYLASLQLVLTQPDTVLLPAHGSPSPSTHSRARELLQHHEVRLDSCLQAVEDAGSTGLEVASRLSWTRHAKTFDELNALNRMLAVTETVAHLKVLVERNSLRAALGGERDTYHPGSGRHNSRPTIASTTPRRST